MQHRVNCTFLFSIKGQTVQNTTVISPFAYTLSSIIQEKALESISKSYMPEFLPEDTDWYLDYCVTVKKIQWKKCILHYFSAQLIEVSNEKPFLFLQQIKKLRRELDSSQEKVATLTSQLAANVSVMREKKKKQSKFISSSIFHLNT